MRYILAVDLETTGLDPTWNEITEIAAILLDENLFAVANFYHRVKVDHPERGIAYDKDGNEVFNVWTYTGIDPNELKDKPTIDWVLSELLSWVREITNKNDLSKICLFGQNVPFDIAFLKAAFKKSKIKYPFDYHSLSLEGMYFFHKVSVDKEFPARLGLDHIMRNIEVKRIGKEHNAMDDIVNTVRSLKKLIEIVRGKATE